MRTNGQPFTVEEDEFIRANRALMSDRSIAEHLHRSIRSVECRARKLNIRRFPMRPFSEDEDARIRNGFGDSSVKIAQELGRAPSVIRARAIRLGLGKWKRENRDFRGYKVAKIDLRDGVYRRLPEHRHILEQHLGRTLTEDERVHHIDGQKRNNRLENLYLCTSNSQHSSAHHSLTRLLPELLRNRVITFDRSEGIYKLMPEHKTD